MDVLIIILPEFLCVEWLAANLSSQCNGIRHVLEYAALNEMAHTSPFPPPPLHGKSFRQVKFSENEIVVSSNEQPLHSAHTVTKLIFCCDYAKLYLLN